MQGGSPPPPGVGSRERSTGFGPLEHPVLEASPIAILGVRADGAILYANRRAEETFGWARAELVGQQVEVLLPEAAGERHVGHRRAWSLVPAARPMGIGMDLHGRRRDGSEFPAEISLAPVQTLQGLITYATVVDISPRRTLEEQLLQAHKMESIGRLAGGIAHDFNNMLFAIRGHASLLLEDLGGLGADADVLAGLSRSVDAIDAAAERAGALVRQLLTFSRRQVVRPSTVAVAESVRSIEPMLRRLIDERVRLVLSLDPAAGSVHVDRSQLDQILVNLVVNARDAMPDGGTITIETRNVTFDESYVVEHFEASPGEYVMLAVSDTGHGMDRETRLHLFEPFFTTKEPGKGTGLGLATIHGIVHQANGHIWVYSEPGRGTRFKVYFPLLDGRAASDAPVPVMERAGRSEQGRILLVEDEMAVRDLTRQVLERAGFEVVAPEDPLEALALLEPGGDAFDIVISDVVMPGVSGRAIVLRAMESRPGVAVVLLSGYSADTAQIDDLVERGALFASKPIATHDLLRVVREARQARPRAAT